MRILGGRGLFFFRQEFVFRKVLHKVQFFPVLVVQLLFLRLLLTVFRVILQLIVRVIRRRFEQFPDRGRVGRLRFFQIKARRVPLLLDLLGEQVRLIDGSEEILVFLGVAEFSLCVGCLPLQVS